MTPDIPAAPPADPARRATLARDTAPLAGHGLNTGRPARLVLRSAPPGTGLLFHRRDHADGAAEPVAVCLAAARVAPFCSALATPAGGLLRTPEHLLAALAAARVDDAVLDLVGEEVPILDGSALPWCEAIAAAGVTRRAAPRHVLRLRHTVDLVLDGRRITAAPAEALHFDVAMDLAHWGTLRWDGVPEGDVFTAELAPARSFGRLKWALPAALLGRLRPRPVLRGAGFGNTAPLVGGRILGGARLPQEPVRHRALDLLGDLALLGAPLVARIAAHRPSHAMNQAFLHHLLAEPGALEWAESRT